MMQNFQILNKNLKNIQIFMKFFDIKRELNFFKYFGIHKYDKKRLKDWDYKLEKFIFKKKIHL